MIRIEVQFTADSSGNNISFSGVLPIIIDDVSLRREVSPEVIPNYEINEVLTGNTDNGREINFRVDTQLIQLMPEFETFANPLAVVTKLQRGTMVKCFIALGDDDFYELEGNATKGVSLVKVHSQNKNIETPPIAREVRISWRDSSKQLCRLTQGGIIFLPTSMSYTE